MLQDGKKTGGSLNLSICSACRVFGTEEELLQETQFMELTGSELAGSECSEATRLEWV